MQNIFIELLPPWIETGLQPAFYDKESGTVLQQTSRMYAKVNELVQSVNHQNDIIADYIEQFNILHDYVHDYFNNLDVQEEINAKLDNMASDGSLMAIIEPYLQPIIDAQNLVISGQNAKLQEMEGTVNTHTAQIANLVSENNPTEGNTELIDIRVADNGYIYTSAGNAVRSQARDNKQLAEVSLKSLKKWWNDFNLVLSSDLFEIGGISSANGENVDTATTVIRTKAYLTFEDIFKFLKVTATTTEPRNIIFLVYAQDDTYLGFENLKGNLPFYNLSANKKYRIALVDDGAVTDVAVTLAKFTFTITSYFKPNNDVYDVDDMNLINPAYCVANCLIDLTTGFLKAQTGQNSCTTVPVEGSAQYYADNANFYTAFFDANMDLIGSVHYTENDPLTSPFTTPANARWMTKAFRTNAVGESAYISKQSTYEDYGDVYVTPKETVHNKPIMEQNLPSNVLHEKTINVYGDSISSTDYVNPYWGDIIATTTGCTINNYGISGTTLAHTDARHLYDYHFTRLDAEEIGYVANNPSTWWSGNCFCERYIKVDDSADAIVIMGGTNDFSVPIGAWNSTDTATFYGALNTLLQGISINMPGKKILVCTPMQQANSYPNNVINPREVLMSKSATELISLQLRAEAIKAKCEQYGIPCLDLYNASGINGIDNNKVYYRTNDNTHPSAIGQTRLATLIQSALEDLFRE